MAREILVRYLCDLCLTIDEQVDGRELAPLWLPELQGRRKRLITLCDRHEKEIYTPLVELLEEHGQPVDDEGQPATKGRPLTYKTVPTLEGDRHPALVRGYKGPITCPDCGKVTDNKAALGSHGRRAHGKNVGQLLGLPTPHECPDCDFRSSGPQGLAAHRRSAHGSTGEEMRAERAEAGLFQAAQAAAPTKRARKGGGK